jgi:protein involved in polysaccharide export with SLBB domain
MLYEEMFMKLYRINLKGLCLSLLGLLLAVGSGCQGPLPASSAVQPIAAPPAVLAAGDTVELRFFYANELTVTQTIRPDGKITLELVGEIQAAGVSPAELAVQLRQLYSVYVKHPDVAVFLRTSYARHVIVAGAVLKPSTLDMPAKMSALDAVMMSGGFNLVQANPSQVLVMRDDGNEGRIAYVLDMSGALAGKPAKSFMLQPEDIVYVPRTLIVNVDQFVAQYIGDIVPDGFVYSHKLSSNDSIGVQQNFNPGQ